MDKEKEKNFESLRELVRRLSGVIVKADLSARPVYIRVAQAMIILNRNMRKFADIQHYDATHKNILESDYEELYQTTAKLNECLGKMIEKYGDQVGEGE